MNAKKAAPDTPQTATERRAADVETSALVATHAPAHAAVFAKARSWLQKRLPTAHEVVYEYRDAVVISYSPDGRGYEAALALRAAANGVQLYFNHGKTLPDPAKLLKGSGAQTRSIVVEGAKTLASTDIAALVDEAIARNPVPYPSDGRGAIVIRSTTAQKRRTT
jgi:hypothetical protein